MKQTLSSFIIISFCGLMLTGCSTLHSSVDPEFALERPCFEVDHTHYHDVLDELGPPARLTATAGGFAFIYEALEIDEKQLGFSGRDGLFQLLKMSFAGTDLERYSYLLCFNAAGELVASGVLESKEDLGTAGSVQAVFSIDQIVDTTAFEDDAFEASLWGRQLLNPLPIMLNSSQNLTTGAAGLEQSGTTTKVGQHTLEMSSF